MNRLKDIITQQLGGGYYIAYREVSNGFGGRHPVDLFFLHDANKVCRQITDSLGFFVDYPGHTPGPWEKDITMTFVPATRFIIFVSKFSDGVCRLSWMVQPDGQYWMDEDGYGMTPEKEVWLYALINGEGQFVTPFFDQHDPRYARDEGRTDNL